MPQRNRELSTDLAKGSGLTPNLYLSAVLKTPLTSGFNSKFGDSQGFPCGSAGKESACNVGDLDSILGLGRSPGEGKGYPLHFSGLQNSMDCRVHGVAKSRTWLSNFHFKRTLVVQSLGHVRLFATPWTTAMPGLPVLHCPPEFDQIHVHWVGDATQSPHLLMPPSPALHLSQHQGLF